MDPPPGYTPAEWRRRMRQVNRNFRIASRQERRRLGKRGCLPILVRLAILAMALYGLGILLLLTIGSR
jgi:hypothetical protein